MKEETEYLTVDKLKVAISTSRLSMGENAAHDVSEKLRELLAKQEFVNIIFAAAPSQNEFLDALIQYKELDWNRVNAFHMDEYIGLKVSHPERFGNFLKGKIFDQVPLHEVYYLNENGSNPQEECQRYTDLLNQYPADIVCMGIGENAHVAFNDPYVADFHDPLRVKKIDLDRKSRQQQVHDNCFPKIEDVPISALTLTVPALLSARFIYCIVPGSNKAPAVYHTLYSGISEKYPSSVLRQHPNATLYLDKNSAEEINHSVSKI